MLHQSTVASEAFARLNSALGDAFREQQLAMKSVTIPLELALVIRRILEFLADEETAGRRGPNSRRRDLLWRKHTDYFAYVAVLATRLRDVPSMEWRAPYGWSDPEEARVMEVITGVVTARQEARVRVRADRRRGKRVALESRYQTSARVFRTSFPGYPQTAESVREAYRRHRIRSRTSLASILETLRPS